MLSAALLAAQAVPAHAQSSGGWFVPKSGQPAAEAPAAAHRRAAPAPAPRPVPVPTAAPAADGDDSGAPQTAPVLPLPPVPALPELAKGAPPPNAVIGVLSVQDVMRQSSAAQQVDKVLGARRDKLNQDAQREQAGWRETQQQLQNAKGLTNDQIQAKERALQNRVTSAQRDFRNRNRIIQEAAQVAFGQIERELVQVIRQVSSAHNMNLVLHREQVALNVPEFDITAQVVTQLNAALPSVVILEDGQDPEIVAKSGKYPTSENPGAQPGIQPAAPPPTVSNPAPAAPKK
ncbi:OmpH family outer membrane protein [Rhizosaccharibacter radicis]|uniref:OmpH family outer membrane protein n=1 Tax=Rhizosaccharibacter radicis TaxID=2782605 RepID=A0ABT1VVQ9_9PROT|nr:OmpH family outer membrane protein [Acetobacteraceae bacterium KSS12]